MKLRLVPLILTFLLVATAQAQPKTTAAAYLLVDHLTGTILAEKAPDEQRRPASLTKLMTAYLMFEAIESGRLQMQDSIVISPTAAAASGHSLKLSSGTELTVRELLLAMIHLSGNDAATALAERLSGEERRFVRLMNQRAIDLGMVSSEFKNSTGLPAVGAKTTARDMITLVTRTHQDFPQLYKLYGIEEFELLGQYFNSINPLLGSYLGAEGLKTGHTFAAGYCLAASAFRHDRNMRLFAVLLGAETKTKRRTEMRNLLDYGFKNFQSLSLFDGELPIVGSAKVWGGKVDRVAIKPAGVTPVKLLLSRKKAKGLEARLQLRTDLEAPLAAETKVGVIVLANDTEVVMEIPAITTETVVAGPWWKQIVDFVRLHWFAPKQRTASR